FRTARKTCARLGLLAGRISRIPRQGRRVQGGVLFLQGGPEEGAWAPGCARGVSRHLSENGSHKLGGDRKPKGGEPPATGLRHCGCEPIREQPPLPTTQ